MSGLNFTAALVERLTHGQERHAQRWQLHLPRRGETAAQIRPLLMLLSLPTFGLALTISVLTTYGPVILIHLVHSPTAVGALIGAEGALAPRRPACLRCALGSIAGLAVRSSAPLCHCRRAARMHGARCPPVQHFDGGRRGHGVGVLRRLLRLLPTVPGPLRRPPPRRLYARAQSVQAIARGVGLGAALLTGGLFLGLWQPLPFLIAAAALAATTLALLPVFRLEAHCRTAVLPYQPASLRVLLRRNSSLRVFGVVNALWEFSFAGLKSFIVLYLVRGVGRSPAVASAVIAVVAVAYIVGAPIAGWLADRYGILRVLRIMSLVYGGGLLVGAFVHTLTPLLIGLPLVALAGAIVLTLPQALAFTLAPRGSEGAAAGLLDFSRGIGVVLGPVAVGAAIGIAEPLLKTRPRVTASCGW